MSVQLNSQYYEMISSFGSDHLYKKIISNAQKNYSIKQLTLETLTPNQVLQLIRKLEEREIERTNNQQDPNYLPTETSWALNEFKLFSWVSVCYAHVAGKFLQQFDKSNYLFLNALFKRKSPEFLEYQVKSLLKQYKVNREKWSNEQTNLLLQIVKEEANTMRWSEISFKLFVKSNKQFYRTPQKCREKWFNHLNPEVNRDKWTPHEDLQLFKCISTHGTKWASISKLFNGARTQHMVKNRYNSIYKKYQSKSQRSSVKKIIDRILDELQKKVNLQELKEQKMHTYSKKTSQTQYNEESVGVNDHLQQLQNLLKEQNQQKKLKPSSQLIQVNRTRNNSVDIEGLMFSENAVQFQFLKQYEGQVQMQQIQLNQDNFRCQEDEYLTSFLF